MSFNKEKAQLIAVLRQRSRGAAADSFEFTLVTALGEAAQGRPEMATTILRSDVPLTKDDREWLAKYIEKSFRRPRHRPTSMIPSPIKQVAARARDGNLTCIKRGTIAEVHWQGKFRGCDFAPRAKWCANSAVRCRTWGRPDLTVGSWAMLARALSAPPL